MLDAGAAPGALNAPRRRTPIGCWVIGAMEDEISGTVWDDDFLLIGARLRPVFGSAVSLDQQEPAYRIGFGRIVVVVTIRQRVGQESRVRIAPGGDHPAPHTSLELVPMGDASAAKRTGPFARSVRARTSFVPLP